MNPGKIFEQDFRSSCPDDIFYYRIKDTFIPPELRGRIQIPKNPFDNMIYSKGLLVLCELKSTSQKSVSFDEKIIKKHQIKELEKYSHIKGVEPGFIFNFRPVNETYFVKIKDFIDFKSNTDRKSIPLSYCQEKGIKIPQHMKRTRWEYSIKFLIEKLIEVVGLIN